MATNNQPGGNAFSSANGSPADAAKTDLPEMPLERVTDGIILDMLHKFRGTDPERDRQIEALIAERNDGIFVSRRFVKGTMLMGPAAQGKTTAFKVAAKWIAERLNMRLLINPSDAVDVGPNDLLLVSSEMSGEVHNTGTTGLPMIRRLAVQAQEEMAAEQGLALPGGGGHGNEYTSYAPDRRLVQARSAGAAIVLFDDALNASPNIQNILLSLAEEGRYRGLDLGPRTYVGLTGNLGALDGSNVHRASAPLRTRVKVLLVMDSVEQWAHRAQLSCTTVVGDGGIAEFLRQNPELFYAPKPRGYGSYPVSRTWDGFLAELEEVSLILHGLRERGALNEALLDKYLGRIRDSAIGFVGNEAAIRFRAFVQANQTNAVPLARDLLKGKGEFSTARAEEFARWLGSGHGLEQRNFASQFALALAEMSAADVVDALPKGVPLSGMPVAAKEAYQVFAKSLMDACEPKVPDAIVARALSHFVVRLAAMDCRIAEFSPKATRPQFLSPEQKAHIQALAQACLETRRGKESVMPGQSFYRVVVVPEISGMNNVQTSGLAADLVDEAFLDEFGRDSGPDKSGQDAT